LKRKETHLGVNSTLSRLGNIYFKVKTLEQLQRVWTESETKTVLILKKGYGDQGRTAGQG